ncbi:Assembly factor cbp4 [Emydomyces testavorans]|uniref:Cytochrome b mRNA-processing protein 4 n=1 Tax=Emydomyces testavorans TaxID=2070801 RepID=A0AAF0DMA9_9EURO|nr:Assembly factor cbp4 [Emydomyces testavorans]
MHAHKEKKRNQKQIAPSTNQSHADPTSPRPNPQRFNPDLQKRNLETRAQRQKEFNDFVTQLKEYSKSDKPIWVVAKEAEEQQNRQRREAAAALAAKKATTENPAEKHDDAIG